MFLLIHEGWCDFFHAGMTKLFRKDFLATPLLNTDRFLDNNDLGLSIPKKYRTPEDGGDPRWNALQPIIEYFDSVAIPNHLQAIKLWSASLPRGTLK